MKSIALDKGPKTVLLSPITSYRESWVVPFFFKTRRNMNLTLTWTAARIVLSNASGRKLLIINERDISSVKSWRWDGITVEIAHRKVYRFSFYTPSKMELFGYWVTILFLGLGNIGGGLSTDDSLLAATSQEEWVNRAKHINTL